MTGTGALTSAAGPMPGLVAAANAAADFFGTVLGDYQQASELLTRFNQALALVQLTGSRLAAEKTLPLAEAGTGINLATSPGRKRFRAALAEFVSAARFEINPELEMRPGRHPRYRRQLRRRVRQGWDGAYDDDEA